MTADSLSTAHVPPPKLMVTQQEAARMLSISERTLYALRKSGRVRAVRLTSGGLRYSVAELRRFAEGEVGDE